MTDLASCRPLSGVIVENRICLFFRESMGSGKEGPPEENLCPKCYFLFVLKIEDVQTCSELCTSISYFSEPQPLF